MLSKRGYALSAALVVSILLLTTCRQAESVRTVEVTVPPERVEVVITSPPEIVEVTREVEQVVEVVVEPESLRPGCTYNAYGMDFTMDYADAENVFNVVFHPDSPFQYTLWDDQNYRDLVEMAMFEVDFDVRVALWQEAENILVTDYAAVIPIFHYDRTVLVRPEIEAVYPPFGAPPFKRWRLPEDETVLQYPIHLDPPTLDTSAVTETVSALILGQIMEPLYEYDAGGRIQPAGAVSHKVSDDGIVYTINLRRGAIWSDGEPVVAQHYVNGIIRSLKPETAAEFAWLMYPIAGAEDFNVGEVDDPSAVGVRAVDDYTLEITLERAASYFDAVLARSTTYPARLDVIEEHGELWWESGGFVGNGAYVLTEWVPEDYVVLEKNPGYWGAGDVTIEQITFSIIADDAVALAAYEQGELDVSGYPDEELPRILEEMPDDFRRLPWPGTYYIGLNLLRSPTDNLNMRKTLASAVDKRAILENVLETPWRVDACSVAPPESPGYRGCGSVGYEFDLEAAQRYLQAAMDEMGVDDPVDISVNVWFNRDEVDEDILGAVAEQWETNLGIKVNVVSSDWAAYVETLDECSR